MTFTSSSLLQIVLNFPFFDWKTCDLYKICKKIKSVCNIVFSGCFIHKSTKSVYFPYVEFLVLVKRVCIILVRFGVSRRFCVQEEYYCIETIMQSPKHKPPVSWIKHTISKVVVNDYLPFCIIENWAPL